MPRFRETRRSGWAAFLCLMLLWSCPAPAQTRFITEFRQDRDVVSMPFEYRNRQILVHGDAGLKRELTFLLDTGSSTPVLESALQVNGYHIADTVVQEAEGESFAESIWLDNLVLGGAGNSVGVHNITTLRMDLSGVSKRVGEKVDGIVGVSFLVGYVLTIDYDHLTLTFRRPRAYTVAGRQPDNKNSFLLSLTASQIGSECVRLSGRLHPKYDYDFLLDTGFGGFISVANEAARESGLFDDSTPRSPVTSSGVSRSFLTYYVRADYLRVGNVDLSGKTVQVDIRNGDYSGQGGIIGNRFLQEFLVELDLPAKRLWLSRAGSLAAVARTTCRYLGFTIRQEGDRLLVDAVVPGGPAGKVGLQGDDEILSVNGKQAVGAETRRILTRLASAQSETALTIHRDAGVGPEVRTLIVSPASEDAPSAAAKP